MKNLKTILEEKEQLLNEYKEQVEPEKRFWNNWKWRPALGLESAIKAINMLMPHEEEFFKFIGEKTIVSICLIISGKGEYIAVDSKHPDGVCNFSYFTINDGKLELAFDGGNCKTAFDKFLNPKKFVLVNGFWRDAAIWGEVEK